MNRLSCVIFDLDGTLADTSRLIFASFNHVAARYTGREWSEDEILGTFGPTEEVAIAGIVGHGNALEAIEEFHRFYEARHAGMAAEHEGIRDVLGFLKSNGIVMALFTGKGRRTTLVTLAAFGLEGYFDMVVTGDDVENHKPAADGIRMVLEAYRFPAESVLMVGDSAPDVIAARSAGVPVAVVAWDSFASSRKPVPEPDFRFGSVGELSEFLRNTVGGGRRGGGAP